MDRIQPKTIVLSLLLTAVLYTTLIPIWFRLRGPYAEIVAAAATGVFPALDLRGDVQSNVGRSITLTYTLPDPRTRGWGVVKQRHLNVPDLPLAAALSLGLLIVPWRRRLIVLAGAVPSLSLVHLTLVLVTAVQLRALLDDQDIPPARLGPLLQRTAEAIGSYRDIAPVVTLMVVGVCTLCVLPRGPVLRHSPVR